MSSSRRAMMSSPATMPILTLPRSPSLRATSANGIAARSWIDPAGVGDDLDVFFDARGQDASHHADEIMRVTKARITRALLLHDRHRDLGEIIEREIVDGPAFD